MDVPSNFGNLLGFERSMTLSLILKRRYAHYNRGTGTEITASMLKLHICLIHFIIGYCIVPRRGIRILINQLDIFLVWDITVAYKLDYASLMFHYILKITNRKKQGLVYGMALTRFFKLYDIPIEHETDIVVPTENEIYTTKTIRLM